MILPDINLLSGHYHPAQKTDANVRTRREKEGRCADCGLQTHRCLEKKKSIFSRPSIIKVPLTIPNEVLRGRCLLCSPTVAPPTPAAAAAAAAQTTTTSSSSSSSVPTDTIQNVGVSYTTSSNSSSSNGLQIQKPPAVIKPITPVSWVTPYSKKKAVKPTSQFSSRMTLPSSSVRVAAAPRKNTSLNSSSSSGTIVSDVEVLYQQSDPTIITQACERLCSACCNPSNREVEVVQAGGIPAIVAVMKRFPHTCDIQNRGIQVLGALASKRKTNIISMHDGYRSVLNGMESFWNTNREAGMNAIQYIARNDSKLLHVDTQRLASLMKRTSDCWGAALDAIRTIFYMAKSGFAQRRILVENMDAISILLHLMGSHKSYSNVIEMACYALAEIGRHEEIYANILVKKGGILALVNVVKTCPSQAQWSGVAKAACVSLCDLSRFSSAYHIIRQLDVSTINLLTVFHNKRCKNEISKLRNIVSWEESI